MSFQFAQVTGNNNLQELIPADSLTEAVVHSLSIYNPTSSALTCDLYHNDKLIIGEIPLPAKQTYTYPKVINVPVDHNFGIRTGAATEVSCSYLKQAIDNTQTLSTAQTLKQEIDTTAANAVTAIESAVGTLPEGSIADSFISTEATWSSQKINTELVRHVVSTSVNYTANSNDIVSVTAEGLVITLPLNPSANILVDILAGPYITTSVDPNGANIEGKPDETLLIDVPNVGVTLIYVDSITGWRIY